MCDNVVFRHEIDKSQGVIQEFIFLGGGGGNTAGSLGAGQCPLFDNLQYTKSVYVTTSMPQCVCVLYMQYQSKSWLDSEES